MNRGELIVAALKNDGLPPRVNYTLLKRFIPTPLRNGFCFFFFAEFLIQERGGFCINYGYLKLVCDFIMIVIKI